MKNYVTSGLAAAAALLTIYGCGDSGTPSPGASGGANASAGSAGTGTLGGAGQTTAGTANSTAGSGTSGAAGNSGTAGSGGGGATTGGSATGGTGGAAGGKGGTGGTAGAGGMTGGSGGQAGGAGGGSGDGWVSILPKDEQLTGWVPYVKGYTPGTDPLKTFRRDATTGALTVSYQDYPDGAFDNHLGLIYYDKKLSNYKVRFEYSFQEPQAKNPVSWGKNNTGIFVFGTDPHQITGNPDFPTAIEIQILGKPSAGGSVNAQICLNSTVGMYPAMIGTKAINAAGGCFASTQSSNDLQTAATWTTVEVEVDGSATGVTKVYQYKDGMKPATPIQTFTGPVKTGGQTVTSGWISFQSESQPCTFRKIDLMELP